MPAREPLHVGYWASAWADRVGLLARAPALRARADIEVCAAAEDAASQQGSSAEKTRLPADGESTAGLRRQAGARRTNSLVSVARPALVTRFAGLVSETGEGRGQILPFATNTLAQKSPCRSTDARRRSQHGREHF